MSKVVLESARLRLRQLDLPDASFIVRLLTDADFVRFIGDRGVSDAESAQAYLRAGPMAMYAEHGIGLWLVERLTDGTPMGICGLLKRPTLEDIDIGYAMLPEFRGQGFALEAAEATLAYAQATLGLRRVVAIVTPHNESSIRLLSKIGMRLERSLRLSEGADEVQLFARDL